MGRWPAVGPCCSCTCGPLRLPLSSVTALLCPGTAPSAVTRPVSRVSYSGTASRSSWSSGPRESARAPACVLQGVLLGFVWFFLHGLGLWLWGRHDSGESVSLPHICSGVHTVTVARGGEPRPPGHGDACRLPAWCPHSPPLVLQSGPGAQRTSRGRAVSPCGEAWCFPPALLFLLLLSGWTHVHLVFARVTPASVSARVRKPDSGFASVGTA